MGLIKQLKQFITGTNIFPITKTSAVYDDNMGRLDAFMKNLAVEADVLETEVEDAPRDADTLGGHLPAYFAKQSDVTTLNSDINTLNGSLKVKVGYIHSTGVFVPTRLVAVQRALTYTNGSATFDISNMGLTMIYPVSVNVIGSASTYGAVVTSANSGSAVTVTLNNTAYSGNLATTILLLCSE